MSESEKSCTELEGRADVTAPPVCCSSVSSIRNMLKFSPSEPLKRFVASPLIIRSMSRKDSTTGRIMMLIVI